jgi:hypothetical protein
MVRRVRMRRLSRSGLHFSQRPIARELFALLICEKCRLEALALETCPYRSHPVKFQLRPGGIQKVEPRRSWFICERLTCKAIASASADFSRSCAI